MPVGPIQFDNYVVPPNADGMPSELGRGAMGITYKAFDTRLRVDVVLKVIRPEMLSSERARHLFLREARAAAKVRHPNVAAVLTLHDEEPYYYAMEFVAGISLAEFLKSRGPLPVGEALDYTDQVAAALGAVSREHIVHRDLKPANIMMVADEERPLGCLLKVIDFGLAKGFTADNVDPETHLRSLTNWRGGFSGTVAYASPEQCGELAEIDGRSDLYSLGIILWQMLVGKLPFTGTLAQMSAMHQHKEPPWDQLAAIPDPVVDILRKLLAKEPEDRFQHARELRSAIGSAFSALGAHGDRRRVVGATPAEGGAMSLDTQAMPSTETVRFGTTLAERFTIGELVAEGDGGSLFKAVDNGGGGALVAMKLMGADRAKDDALCGRLRDELERVRRKPTGVLLQPISSLLRSGDSVFFVREWAAGFSLEEMLRLRDGQLSATEVWRLLRELPDALDDAAAENLTLAEPLLRKLFACPFATGATVVDWPALRTHSVSEWPEFRLRWNPVSFRPARIAETAITVTQMTELNAGVTEDRVRALAMLLRELLGGRPGALTPLPSLNDEANAVLQRALSPGGGMRSFPSARAFWDALPKIASAAGGRVSAPAAEPASALNGGEGRAERTSGKSRLALQILTLLVVAGATGTLVWRYKAAPAAPTSPTIVASNPIVAPTSVPLAVPTATPSAPASSSSANAPPSAPAAAAPTESVSPLPAAAEGALNNGLTASKQNEWGLAIRYLEDARKAAPYAPQILTSLAQAESQVLGREPRAIAWLESLLALQPPKEGDAAARKQIAALQLKVEANIGQIISTLNQLASGFAAGSGEANSARQSIGDIQAHFGDFDAAVASAQRLLPDKNAASPVASIVDALAEEGQYDTAKRIAGQVPDEYWRAIAYFNVMSRQARQNKMDDARATFASINEPLTQRRALYELAQAEAKADDLNRAKQHVAHAEDLVRAMKAKERYEIASRSQALQELVRVRLDIGDWKGAIALLPLIVNDSNIAYHDQAIDDVAPRMADLSRAEASKGNWAAAEAIADAIPSVDVRATAYAAITLQNGAKSNPDRVSALARKTEPLIAQAPRAKEKLFVASALCDMANVRGDKVAAARWRNQAVGYAGPALQEPVKIRADLGKTLGGNWKILERLRGYWIANELQRICTGCVAAEDEGALRKISDVARAGVPKADESTRGQLIQTWRTALFAVASKTRSPSDSAAVVKFARDNPKSVGSADLRNLAMALGDAGDDASAQSILNAIADAGERTSAANSYNVRKFSRQYDAALRNLDFKSAAQALAQIPEGSDRSSKRQQLIGAMAGEGDFAAAGKIAAEIPDTKERIDALGRIASEKADAGDNSAQAEVWQQKRAMLAGITDPIQRLEMFWPLASGAPTTKLARELIPSFFAEARAVSDPSKRANQLRWVSFAARRVGLYSIQREARSEALGPPGIEKWYGGTATDLELDASECLQQATGPGKEYFLGAAANRLTAAGDLARAQKNAATISGDKADDSQALLASAFAERGDFNSARSAWEKITNNYARELALRSVIHAYVKAGNSTAAKQFAEQHWPQSANVGRDIVVELANAGEIAWASANLKRLDNGSYEQDARRTIVALQMEAGDFSGADAAMAACTADYDRARLIRAAAKGGRFDLALRWLKTYNIGRYDLITAKVVAGDVAGARALAAEPSQNRERVIALRVLAGAQARAGDVDGARATFRESARIDKRTPEKFDAESFADWQLASALLSKPDVPAALAVAGAIHDQTLRDRALTSVSYSAATKDVSSVTAALKAMGDPLERSLAASFAVDTALREKHAADAASYAALASDESFRAMCVGSLMRYGIEHGDIADVTPLALGTSDPTSRIWILTDALRGKAYLDVKVDDSPILAAVQSAIESVKSGYLRARLLAELARVVERFDAAKGAELQKQATTLFAQLTGDDASERDRESSRITATTSDPKSGTSDPATKARMEIADQWSSLVQYYLSEPIITDFRVTMDNLPNSVPAGAANRAMMVFNNTSTQANKLVAAMKQIRAKRAELAAKAAENAAQKK
jgi:serine/threonine protein kinase